MEPLTVSYLRVSTQGQVERESIESQRFMLNTYFQQRSIKPDRQFEDAGVSGCVEIHQRPQGGELYRLIAAGEVKTLYTFALDRIGRDVVDTLLFARLCESRGVQVIGISDGTDTNRESSTFEIEIRSIIAAQYRRDRVRQSKAGLRRRASEGRINNKPPFGFRVEDGRLVEDELKAETVREIFRRAARGERTRQIVQHLNESGAPSPSGKGWRHDTVVWLLKNSTYRGEYPAFVTPRRRPGGGKRIKRDPADKVIINCPAIVPAELFAMVQDRLTFNRQWHAAPQKYFYLLKSLVRCACGLAYVGHTITGRKYRDKRYPNFTYYECGSLTNRDYKFCGNARVNAARLEEIVWSEIEGFILSPSKALERVAVSYNAEANRGGSSDQQRRRKLEALRTKNTEARDRLTLAVARGVVTDIDAIRARDALTSEASEIEKQLRDIDDSYTRRVAERRRLLDAEALLHALRDKLDQGLTRETKAELVRCLVRRILVERGEDRRPLVTISYAFTPSFSFSPFGFALSASSLKK